MGEVVESPLVTVLMPVYNASAHVADAIESILHQSYKDFILLIINDGSGDDSEKIIRSYTDPRIVYIKNDHNIGLVKTLNKGIELTTTTYMARMDADDISLPYRLEKQVAFLEKHFHIGVCGSHFEKFGYETGSPPLHIHDEEIKAGLLFSNGICHPSVMIRTAVLKENKIAFGVNFNYSDDFGHKLLEFEDYALWHKLKNVTGFANLPDVLLKYRKEGQNLSVQNMQAIQHRRLDFICFLLDELEVEYQKHACLLHCSYTEIKKTTVYADLKTLKIHFENILKANEKKKIYPENTLKKIVSEQWQNVFYYVVEKGIFCTLNYWIITGITYQQMKYAIKVWAVRFIKRENKPIEM